VGITFEGALKNEALTGPKRTALQAHLLEGLFFCYTSLMNQTVAVLVVLVKGQLLMQRGGDGVVAAFEGTPDPREITVRTAVRILDQEAGLKVQPGDLEFLDAYTDGATQEIQVFVMAGVGEDRVHAYGGEDSLCKIHRNDDFTAAGLSLIARKYVIDYFKRHKK